MSTHLTAQSISIQQHPLSPIFPSALFFLKFAEGMNEVSLFLFFGHFLRGCMCVCVCLNFVYSLEAYFFCSSPGAPGNRSTTCQRPVDIDPLRIIIPVFFFSPTPSCSSLASFFPRIFYILSMNHIVYFDDVSVHIFSKKNEMDVGWGSTHGAPGHCTKGTLFYKRSYFKSNFFERHPHPSCSKNGGGCTLHPLLYRSP